eukprot:1787835-Rhodomonas_salina.4
MLLPVAHHAMLLCLSLLGKLLRAFYALTGAIQSPFFYGTSLRVFYAMSSTELLYGLRGCYAMSSTELAYDASLLSYAVATRCPVLSFLYGAVYCMLDYLRMSGGQHMVLSASYAMSGTEIAHAAIRKRTCSTISGTEIAQACITLRACYAECGTEIAYGRACYAESGTEIAIALRACYGECGTEIGYADRDPVAGSRSSKPGQELHRRSLCANVLRVRYLLLLLDDGRYRRRDVPFSFSGMPGYLAPYPRVPSGTSGYLAPYPRVPSGHMRGCLEPYTRVPSGHMHDKGHVVKAISLACRRSSWTLSAAIGSRV